MLYLDYYSLIKKLSHKDGPNILSPNTYIFLVHNLLYTQVPFLENLKTNYKQRYVTKYGLIWSMYWPPIVQIITYSIDMSLRQNRPMNENLNTYWQVKPTVTSLVNYYLKWGQPFLTSISSHTVVVIANMALIWSKNGHNIIQ